MYIHKKQVQINENYVIFIRRHDEPLESAPKYPYRIHFELSTKAQIYWFFESREERDTVFEELEKSRIPHDPDPEIFKPLISAIESISKAVSGLENLYYKSKL